MDTDLTVQILREIRADIAGISQRVDQTNERLDQTNARMEAGFADLGRRIDLTNRHMLTMEARLSSEISALRAEVHDLRATR